MYAVYILVNTCWERKNWCGTGNDDPPTPKGLPTPPYFLQPLIFIRPIASYIIVDISCLIDMMMTPAIADAIK